MKRLFGALLILLLSFGLINTSAYADNKNETGNHSETMRAGFFYLDGFHEKDENGNLSGYGYDISQAINQFYGWDIEYVGYDKSFPEHLEMLENGQIDFLLNATYTDERADKFLYSDYDIGNCDIIITIRNDDIHLKSDIDLWNGVRVGYLKGDQSLQILYDYLNRLNINYSLVEFDYFSQLNNDIENGDKADVFYCGGFRKLRDNEAVFKTLSEGYTYIITRKDDEELMDDINQALATMIKYDPDVFPKLKEKNFNVKEHLYPYLNREQRDYINENKGKVLKALVLGDNQPLCYKENGINRGIIPEYISLLENASGLTFAIITANSIEEYENYINSGLVDVCLDTEFNFTIADKYDLRLTNAYLDIPIKKVSLQNVSHFDNNVGLFAAGVRYTVPQYSDYNIRYYTNCNEMMKDLDSHIISDAYMPSYLADYYINNQFFKAYVAEPIDENYSLCISVINKDDVILANIISDTVYFVGDAVLQRIILNEIDKSTSKNLVSYLSKNPLIIWGIFAGFLFLVTLITILLYGANNARRQKKLADINLSYFKTFLSNFNFAIEVIVKADNKKSFIFYKIDENNEIFKVNATENDLLKYASRILPEQIDDFLNLFSDSVLNSITREHESVYKEYKALINDNHYSHISVTMRALAGSEKDRILLFVKDIDAIKIEEEERRNTLQMALDTAKEFAKSKNSFLSQMSHDIRTPLNAIVGMATLSELSLDDTDKVKEYLDSILDASDHLISLVNDILDVTRIESGKFFFTQKRIRITSPLEKAIEILNIKAVEKNIHINVSSEDISHYNVLADSQRLEQIFINLISNAIKYSNDNSSIDVILREDYCKDDKFYYEFIVTDYGIGMSDETIANLFEPFTRGEEAKKHDGTGLGMTITKSIIDAMGGVISVDSNINEGTTIKVSLCFSDIESSGINELTDIKGEKAIIVSPYSDLKDSLKILFSEANVTCDCVETSLDVLRKIKNNKYKLIIINLDLSVDDEIALVKKIRKVAGESIIIGIFDQDEIANEMVYKNCTIDSILPFEFKNRDIVRSIYDAFDSRALSKKIKIEKTIKNNRALIVEDVDINAMYIEGIANMKGFETDIVTNGLEALNILEEKPDNYYNIIFMDIQMPVMDGYEATKRIRSSERDYLKKIPIIAMSANTFPEDILRCKVAGMTEHMSKPIDINKFNEISDKYSV